MSTDNFPDFDTMSKADFEHFLPDFFANTPGGKVSADPRLRRFLDRNPDCAALVRDLEIIAEHAKSLFQTVEDPTDTLWDRIASELHTDPALLTPKAEGE